MTIAMASMLLSGVADLFGGSSTQQNLPTSGNSSSFASMVSSTSATSGFGATSYSSSRVSTSTNATLQSLQQSSQYFSESPEQRMQTDWLSQHHITSQQYANMTTEQKEGISREMQQDIEAKTKEKLDGASDGTASITTATNAI